MRGIATTSVTTTTTTNQPIYLPIFFNLSEGISLAELSHLIQTKKIHLETNNPYKVLRPIKTIYVLRVSLLVLSIDKTHYYLIKRTIDPQERSGL